MFRFRSRAEFIADAIRRGCFALIDVGHCNQLRGWRHTGLGEHLASESDERSAKKLPPGHEYLSSEPVTLVMTIASEPAMFQQMTWALGGAQTARPVDSSQTAVHEPCSY